MSNNQSFTPINLTSEQQNRLDFLLQSNRYPEAYGYAKQVVIANGGDPRISNWLDKAADINEGNPSNFYSTIVRSATIEAANDQGMSLDNSQFQFASNCLAKEVIGGFVNNGAIKDIESIIAQDVKSAVKGLGLTPEGWAGTMMGWAPIDYGGLGLSFDGQFYSYLAKDWKERGIDSHFKKLVLALDVAENNLVGVIDFSKEMLGEKLLSASSFVSSILDDIRDAMNALKDPLIIDLKNDGLNLSNPDNRYIEPIYFDLNNDGIKEKTGWIIPKYEVINSTDGISKGFITNNSFYFEGDKEQAQQGWNISYSNITYTATEGQTKQVVAVDFTTNPIGYEFNDVNLGKLATSEEGIKSLVISNPNGETVIAGADTAQNIFNNLSSFFGRSLRVFLSAVFCLGIFLEGSWASNTKHSKKECLNLTTEDKTFDNSANRIMKLKTVSEFLALLRKHNLALSKKDKLEKVSLVFTLSLSEPKYINNKCFWHMRLVEDHQTHLVFWKSFLVDVDIDGSNIYEEDVELDSYHIIK